MEENTNRFSRILTDLGNQVGRSGPARRPRSNRARRSTNIEEGAISPFPGDSYFVESGYFYFPLLVDSKLYGALEELVSGAQPQSPAGDIILDRDGISYVRGIKVSSLVENAQLYLPDDWNRIHRKIVSLGQSDSLDEINVPPKLNKIITQALPRYVKLGTITNPILPGADRLTILDAVHERIKDQQASELGRFYAQAQEIISGHTLEGQIADLEAQKTNDAPFSLTTSPSTYQNRRNPGGQAQAGFFESWLYSAVRNRVIDARLAQLRELNQIGDGASSGSYEAVATLMFLASADEFSLEKFGWMKETSRSDFPTGSYTIFKHTGPYALQHFDGDCYRFEDCRVAVNLEMPNAMVLGRYHHPFLHSSSVISLYNPICIVDKIRDRTDGEDMQKICEILDQGIDVILRGYVDNVGFHPYSYLNDGTYTRISRSNRRITSGEIPITNAPTLRRE